MSSKNSVSKKNTSHIKKSLCTIVIFLISFAAIFMAVRSLYNSYIHSGISEIDESINYEEQLLNYASFSGSSKNPHLDDISINSAEDGKNYYYVNIILDGSDYLFGYEISPDLFTDAVDEEAVNDGLKLSKFSKHHELMIESARKHVIKFIKDSNILTDKEMLIEEIENVPFYLYSKGTYSKLNTDAPAIYLQNGIYCNKAQSEYFCEVMFIHELVHHLRFVTLDKNPRALRYVGTYFDETMTDFIALNMNPDSPFASVYSKFYFPMYRYLGIFKEDALKAFFYGYDDFFAKHGGKSFQIEHDCFDTVLQYYNKAVDSPIIIEAISNTWSAR